MEEVKVFKEQCVKKVKDKKVTFGEKHLDEG